MPTPTIDQLPPMPESRVNPWEADAAPGPQVELPEDATLRDLHEAVGEVEPNVHVDVAPVVGRKALTLVDVVSRSEQSFDRRLEKIGTTPRPIEVAKTPSVLFPVRVRRAHLNKRG